MARLCHALVLTALTMVSISRATSIPARLTHRVARGPTPNHIDKDEHGMLPSGDTRMVYLWSKVRI